MLMPLVNPQAFHWKQYLSLFIINFGYYRGTIGLLSSQGAYPGSIISVSLFGPSSIIYELPGLFYGICVPLYPCQRLYWIRRLAECVNIRLEAV
jgi:hypothetical protein